jgi:hypothetical protein
VILFTNDDTVVDKLPTFNTVMTSHILSCNREPYLLNIIHTTAPNPEVEENSGFRNRLHFLAVPDVFMVLHLLQKKAYRVSKSTDSLLIPQTRMPTVKCIDALWTVK